MVDDGVVIERHFDAPVELVWKMWFGGEHREVIENELLVYTESMTDEHGNIASPAETGMPEDHPITTEVRVELEDVGARTKMVMTHTGVPADSPGAAGWTMAFDKLAAQLEPERTTTAPGDGRRALR